MKNYKKTNKLLRNIFVFHNFCQPKQKTKNGKKSSIMSIRGRRVYANLLTLLALPPRIFRLSYSPAQALTLISFPSFRPFAVHLPVLVFFCDVVDTKFRHYIHLCIFKFFVLMRAAAAVSWNLKPRASSFLPVYRRIIVQRSVEIQTLNQSQQSLQSRVKISVFG